VSRKPKPGLRLLARWRATNGYLRFGTFATIGIFGLVILLSFGEVAESKLPRWRAFWNASPNEIGDTIAGIAGTLAFLWIIVTVLMQGNELRLQRRELAMTRRELSAQRKASEQMAQAQAAQVNALQLQGEIFLDEQRTRRHVEASNTLHRYFDLLIARFQEHKKTIGIAGPRGRNFENLSAHKIRSDDSIDGSYLIYCPFMSRSEAEIGKLPIIIGKNASMALGFFSTVGKENLSSIKCVGSSELEEIRDVLAEIVAISDDLSKADEIKLEELRVRECLQSVTMLLTVFKKRSGRRSK